MVVSEQGFLLNAAASPGATSPALEVAWWASLTLSRGQQRAHRTALCLLPVRSMGGSGGGMACPASHYAMEADPSLAAGQGDGVVPESW